MAFTVLLGKGGLRRWDVSVIAFLSGGRNEGVGNPSIPKPFHASLSIQAVAECTVSSGLTLKNTDFDLKICNG